jgi:hypothetical protein
MIAAGAGGRVQVSAQQVCRTVMVSRRVPTIAVHEVRTLSPQIAAACVG